MPLHVIQYRDHMTMQNRRVSQAILPPVMERRIWAYVVLLFWAQCFAKSITRIQASDKMILQHRISIEELCGILVDAQGVCVIQRVHLT